MNHFSSIHTQKRGFSIAEYSVLVVVLSILFAAIIPIFIRINAYKRNVQRITDIKSITQQVQVYNTKVGEYPRSLKDITSAGLGDIPKDPQNKVYCMGAQGYSSGDYQYYTCKDCEAIGPLKTYSMKNIVQIGALMERENERGDRNSGNRWSPYTLGEPTNCAANGVRGVGTLLEGVKGNWIGGTGTNTVNFVTNITQKNYEPRYNVIISNERK